MNRVSFMKVFIDKKAFIDRSDWVKYLTLSIYHNELIGKENPEILEARPSEAFFEFVETQIHSYLEGKTPEREIQAAIMNCADMYASGEAIALRAGDYITLQNFHQNSIKQGR